MARSLTRLFPGMGIALPGRLRRLAPALGLVLAAVVLLVALDSLATYGARRWALSQVRAEAAAAADLRVAVLRSEIEKQGTLPVVLAQDPDVRRALESRDPARLSALDAKFEGLADATRASAIYLLDKTGMTLAASNYRSAQSFVGNDYGFRPYFRRAMEVGSAEHFAFGSVSLKPGLYLTRRVEGAEEPLGVLVVKAEFLAMEADWARLSEPTFVTDQRSIVLVTSVPPWRFKAIAPIPPDQRAEIRASLQFGDADLDVLAFGATADGQDIVEATLPGERMARRFVEVSAPVPATGWTLHVLAPLAPATSLAATAARSLAMLLGVLGIGAAGLYLARRRRLKEERSRQAAARRELEERVAARTAELSEANHNLVAEMEARRNARAAVEALQDELVQASKLAVLGQISASIAHEVNQPVAAIRAFADNSRAFLDRGDTDEARANLATIAALTERIGAITGELRAFARKSTREIAPVSLRKAMEGALLLVGYRLREQAIHMSLEMQPEDMLVNADHMRLEQVFVNLLQNALEALGDRPDGRIRVRAERSGASAIVTIADNGPGLPEAVMAALFLPFTTTKPNGLGLGLVICHDIVAEFGGTIAAENKEGAVFTITLPGTCTLPGAA